MRYCELLENAAAESVVNDPKFQIWFRGSQVVDSDGTPLLCYHGTPERVDVSAFRPFSHFGTVEAAQDRLMKKNTRFFPTGSNIIPVFLCIKNPIDMPDLDTHMTTDRMIIMALRRFDDSRRYYRMPKFRLEMEAPKLLNQFGVDGFRYQNVAEHKGSTSWVILNKEQVWPLFGGGEMDAIRADKARKDAEYLQWLAKNWHR